MHKLCSINKDNSKIKFTNVKCAEKSFSLKQTSSNTNKKKISKIVVLTLNWLILLGTSIFVQNLD
jgi:hypothetical protein